MKRIVTLFFLMSTMSCQALFHKMRYWDFSRDSLVDIDAEKLGRIQPGVTTERDLLKLFEGRYRDKFTYSRPLEQSKNDKTVQVDRLYLFQDLSTVQTRTNDSLSESAWTERILLSVGLSKGLVCLVEVAHSMRDENGDSIRGHLDTVSDLSPKEKAQRECRLTYYDHYSLGLDVPEFRLRDCGFLP